MSLLLQLNLFGNALLACYLVMSLLEYCVLESGKSHLCVPWSSLRDFPSLVMGHPTSAAARNARDDEDVDPEAIRVTR